MKTLILINGFPGVGKTTISQKLFQELENIALIDTDDLMHVRPWEPNEQLFKIALGNALLCAQNFFTNGYDKLILAGCVHSKELFSLVDDVFGDGYNILCIHLSIDEDTRKERIGDRYESLKPSLSPDDVAPAKFVEIDTGKNSIGEVIHAIRKHL